MGELKDKKLHEEIELLRAERKSLKYRFFFDIIKTVSVFCGAVFVFWVIQNPESILRRQSSHVQVSKERFTSIQEILKEKDNSRKKELIIALKAAYSAPNEWLEYIEFIESQIAQELSLKAVSNISKNKELTKLINEKEQQLNRLKQIYLAEVSGTGGSMVAGIGHEAIRIRRAIESLNDEISTLLKNIAKSN